jgi:hypothetical protein
MKKTLVVRVKVRIDVDIDAYEREYGTLVSTSMFAEVTPSNIREDLQLIARASVESHLAPLSNVYTVVDEA